jgi:hypothetical protein
VTEPIDREGASTAAWSRRRGVDPAFELAAPTGPEASASDGFVRLEWQPMGL